MFCTLSCYRCTVHDKLQCFCWQVLRTFVWKLQYSSLQFQILWFAPLNILVCRSERSRGDSSSAMGRDTRERMGLWGWCPLDWWDLGYLTKIWDEVRERKGGEVMDLRIGILDWLFSGILFGWSNGCWKSNRMSPQLYTVGWTTLEPLSPWCPTSQKATGASTTVTQESKVSQTPSNSDFWT